MEDFFEKCRTILAEHLGISPETIKQETTFEEIGADSIDIVEMIMAVEDYYDVEFPEEDLDEYKTMGALVKALFKFINNKG